MYVLHVHTVTQTTTKSFHKIIVFLPAPKKKIFTGTGKASKTKSKRNGYKAYGVPFGWHHLRCVRKLEAFLIPKMQFSKLAQSSVKVWRQLHYKNLLDRLCENNIFINLISYFFVLFII